MHRAFHILIISGWKDVAFEQVSSMQVSGDK